MALTLYSPTTLITYLMSLLVGLLFALIMPTLSVLVADGLGVRPFLVGAFFVAVAVTSIVFSQLLAGWSDRLRDRRPLILVGMLCGAAACLVFAFSRNYWIVLLAGSSFFSLSFAFTAQMFAHAREFADQRLPGGSNTLYNSIIRACIALAWVSGPPLGFALYYSLGITLHYSAVAGGYVAAGLLAWLALPKAEKFDVTPPAPIGRNDKIQVITAVVAFSLLYACNQTYLISMPLYLPDHLDLSSQYAGWVMGTAAALEIPVMIFGGWLGSRFRLLSLIRIGAFAAAILYIGIWQATALWQLFVLQLLNAVFIGFVAGLGMTWFQNMMPGKTGTASTLYLNSNNIGNLLGSLIVAAFAELLGYRDIFVVLIVVAGLAIVTLSVCDWLRRKHAV